MKIFSKINLENNETKVWGNCWNEKYEKICLMKGREDKKMK